MPALLLPLQPLQISIIIPTKHITLPSKSHHNLLVLLLSYALISNSVPSHAIDVQVAVLVEVAFHASFFFVEGVWDFASFEFSVVGGGWVEGVVVVDAGVAWDFAVF